jgi:hypothetical protein
MAPMVEIHENAATEYLARLIALSPLSAENLTELRTSISFPSFWSFFLGSADED